MTKDTQPPQPLYFGVIQGDLPGQQALRDFVKARELYWADPPRGACHNCGSLNELLGSLDPQDPGTDPATALYCAQCRRNASDRRALGNYPCDRCQNQGAFRDPLHRRDEYLCPSCHTRNGYEPGERAMISKIQKRVGPTHPLGRKAHCILRSTESTCGGQVKQRADKGEICDKHWNPKKYLANLGH